MSPALDRLSEPQSAACHRTPDFASVTEQPGLPTTREGLSMLHARYAFAAGFCAGKNVLEVACGAGMGLGLLAKTASRLVAVDFSESLLRRVRKHYGDRIPLLRLDAHSLPFNASSFDVILLFEAIYYLRNPLEFVRECRRVLRAGGVLLICTANPACPGFNRSPMSQRYFCAEELRSLLREFQFSPEIHGAFPWSADTLRDKSVAAIRSAAVRFHLVPRTMKGKALLKKVFYGRLTRIEDEVPEGMSTPVELHPIAAGENPARYKILFALGRC
ncbi:MAG TPA: class I SAM-dependent methyltransferase [Candidatus Acidoferrales bacterium]|nr:class I SAM-dependent methyltransferase [Candidatus Acidoferrales bacterium]